MRSFYGIFEGEGGKSMHKPSYDDLAGLLTKIYKETKIESAVGVEWANYPIEAFDELASIMGDLNVKADGSRNE